MQNFGFLNSKCIFPKPASPQLAKIGLERWIEAANLNEQEGNKDLATFSKQMTKDSYGIKILEAVFGNSPFLTSAILKEPAFFQKLIEQGPEKTMREILTEIKNKPPDNNNDKKTTKNLRVYKRRTSLTIALADITGLWSLKKVTEELSNFAAIALRLAAAQVLKDASIQGHLTLKFTDDPERDSGFIIIAMGKLGGRELNYSSDIDLIILFDSEKVKTDRPQDLQNCFVRLTRNLVRLIDERTQDGYVFRTDLRLRPDPGVTPIALSVASAETYYESLGQNWERAAMIKAHAVAGDIVAGEAFLKRLAPFIWRKNLDFSAIQDIQSIKRQIHAHRGGTAITVGGHNVKLGRGGIREIEFFAQTQQLIWGGRLASLRSPITCETLITLAKKGLCKNSTANDLIRAYEFLRRLEHRLQMVNDEQTHIIPAAPEEIIKIGIFMGYSKNKDFTHELTRNLVTVQKHYDNLYSETPTLSGINNVNDTGPSNLVFTGAESDPETLTTLEKLGFKEAKMIDSTVRGWHHGRIRATRSKRAREILTELMPILLKAISKTPAADQAFLGFDRFLSKLPAGVQLFSMFQANPNLLDLIANIIGKAPRLADHLSKSPTTLDSVLTQDFFYPPPEKSALEKELKKVLESYEYFEQKLDFSRRWKSERYFQVGVQCLNGIIQPREAGPAFSNIADATIKGLFPIIEKEFVTKHGHLPGCRIEQSSIAVLALGKLGSREITAASDLDLVFVYNTPEINTFNTIASDGIQPLGTIQYYNRLSQRLISGLTAMTSEGQLYKIDMRLRPSGANGLIASSLEAFQRYHSEFAWTWEHLALTRARVILGPPELSKRLTSTVRNILRNPRDEKSLLQNVALMRKRIEEERHTDCIFSLKHHRGGLVDIEFIAQYMTLKYAQKHPNLIGLSTRKTIVALQKAKLLAPINGEYLTETLDCWHDLQGLLALTIEGDINIKKENIFSEALKEDLVRVASNYIDSASGHTNDFDNLKKAITMRAKKVYYIFRNLIEIPAAELIHK